MANSDGHIGSFEVLRELGRGGMGVVYLARDTKLDRQVALKTLPEHLVADPDRLSRFEREAKVLASLNHPGIAAIYGLEEHARQRYLILEYVEGPTLEDRLGAGPLPVQEALRYAVQIAEALEVAHEKGVIHRDLKPANIVLTGEDKLKVLDFGLARTPDGSTSSTHFIGAADSPTIDSPMHLHSPTIPGVIMGTAGYMSPEQARGKAVDKRSDIFSFGCVFYEMLSGVQPFRGESVADSLGATLHKEVDFTALPAQTPWAVRQLLTRCLAKDRNRRLRDIGDARVELEQVLSEPATASVGTAKPISSGSKQKSWIASARVAWGVCAILALFTLWTTFGRDPSSRSQSTTAVSLSVTDQGVLPSAGNLAIAPGGEFLVIRGDGVADERRLRLRRLDSFDARFLDSTNGAYGPFVAPDGDGIAFFTETELRTTTTSGASSQYVCDAFGYTTGVWGRDGRIVFSSSRKGEGAQPGLSRVLATGGEPEILTSSDPAQGERDHAHPFLMPDGKHVLFTIEAAGGSKVALLSLETREQRVILEDAAQPMFVPPATLLYHDPDSLELFAVPFDPKSLMATDRRVQVLADLTRQVVLSGDGTLAYVPVTNESANIAVWIDRTGAISPLMDKPGSWMEPRISPDGRTLLLRQTGSPDCFLWLFEIERGILSRLTFEGDSHGPQWGADGRSVFVGIEGTATRALYRVAIDGATSPERIWGANGPVYLGRGSADGTLIPLSEELSPQNRDIWVLRMGDEVEAEQFLQSSFDERSPAFSPNGRWLAYSSNESGIEQVYVRKYPGGSGKTQISIDGGVDPLWSPSGEELFYIRSGKLYGVQVNSGVTWQVSTPRLILDTDLSWDRVANFDISSDGQRFVMIEREGEGNSGGDVRVILNWTAGLKARVGEE